MAEMAALKMGCVCAASGTRARTLRGSIFISGRSGRGRCGSANRGGEGGEDKDEGRGLGFEATIAPNTHHTSILTAKRENWLGHGKGGLYSCKALVS